MALRDQKDVLIAWINGESIQVKLGDMWYDCDKFDDRGTISVGGSSEYRIKPKEIVTTTFIQRTSSDTHQTFTRDCLPYKHNLRLTWSEDGETLLKAEVI
jgi:hypothetical protein